MEPLRKIDKFFICLCYGEGVRFSYWPDDKEMYLSLWKTRSYGKPCWRQRLRHIWKIIRDGEPWEDEVVLTVEEAKAMGKFLSNLDEVQP